MHPDPYMNFPGQASTAQIVRDHPLIQFTGAGFTRV